jgi:HlyD family secretion protein
MTVKLKIIGIIVGGAVLAAAAAGIRYGVGCQSCSVRWLGYADADYVNVSPTLAGRLTSLDVERGDQIAAGARLFTQDDIDDRAARDEARATLHQATEKLADLNAPGRSEEISQAQAEVSDKRAAYERVARDLARAEYTAATGATSRQALDQLRADTGSAAARLEAAQAKLDLIADTSGRAHEIAAQSAAVTAAGARRDAAQWRLDQREVIATVAGRVADTYAQPGETVSAGAPVVSLLPPENIFVRFYVPETALALVHPVRRSASPVTVARKA